MVRAAGYIALPLPKSEAWAIGMFTASLQIGEKQVAPERARQN